MDSQISLTGWTYRLRLAVSFLTIFPVGALEYRPGELVRSSLYFPLVGLGIGVINLGIWRMTLFLLDDRWSAALAVTVTWVLVTRGLHLDGAADIGDALWGGATPERRREILADSRLGTFGVVTIFMLLTGKLVALTGMEHSMVLVLAPAFGRIGSVFMGALFPPFPAGSKGLGHQLRGLVPRWYGFCWAIALALLGLGFGLSGWFLLKMAAVFIMIYLWGKWLVRQFQGVNGDGLGAGIEWAECLILFLGR